MRSFNCRRRRRFRRRLSYSGWTIILPQQLSSTQFSSHFQFEKVFGNPSLRMLLDAATGMAQTKGVYFLAIWEERKRGAPASTSKQMSGPNLEYTHAQRIAELAT